MKILNQAKLKLAKMLNLEFASVSTDKGNLYYDGDGELIEGIEVYQNDSDGNQAPAEDGEYITESRVVNVSGGVVASIVSKDAIVEDELKEVTREEFDELKAMVSELASVINSNVVEAVESIEATVESIQEDVEEIKSDVQELDGEFKKAVKTPIKVKASSVKVNPSKRESQLSKFGL